ncbi:hypothetical protein EV182_004679 [Spiromyces aspiralis]|uniref:Uncharacterized protein n=1 Tax=Spiromyces aspiralis TaxID=68401 RepID=A0ACC1HS24_9FUNG|nr:hypothetical protein EV182_004679 [Spiromyces aspiralis]
MDLQRTPSVVSGWTVEREEMDRNKAVVLIQMAARKLKLPQVTVSTACVLLHRFYMRYSLREYHHYTIAATSLFLACKAEETLRKLEDFIPIVAYYTSKGTRRAPPGSSEYEKWRHVILYHEFLMLEACCFDLVINNPYQYIVAMSRTLRLDKRLTQMAWNFVADCLRVPMPVIFPPNVIAAISIALAYKVNDMDYTFGQKDPWTTGFSIPLESIKGFYVREAHMRMSVGSVADRTPDTPSGLIASSPNCESSPPHVPTQQSPAISTTAADSKAMVATTVAAKSSSSSSMAVQNMRV